MKITLKTFCVTFFYFYSYNIRKLPQSPDLENAGSKFIYGGLTYGDSREEVLSKLRKQGFIQIYEERDEGVVRCAVRWDGLRYELVSKLVNDKLELCLIEGNKGWQDFHFNDVVTEEWEKLRKDHPKAWETKKTRSFPEIFETDQ